MTEDAAVGAFVCSCADTCEIDLETARERIDGVSIAASSDLLCGERTIEDAIAVVEERELEELILTCPAPAARRKLERIERETGASVHFVDQREGAGWVHGERAATEKTARLVGAARAGLGVDGEPETVTSTGTDVAVVGDATLAASLPDGADVTLIADGRELEDVAVDLEDIRIERGRVVDVSGSLGRFELTLESRVTEACVDCMACHRAGPEGAITRRPVDVEPGTSGGEWVDVCPTDAIELGGIERTLRFDQVVNPDGADDAPGGTTGYHTDTGLAVAAVSELLAVERPSHLELEMDVCASGESGQEGCRLCHDACPHGAVSKPAADEVAFDLAACRNCGACTSSCPTGAVSLADRSNRRLAREVEALLVEEPPSGLLDRSEPPIEPAVLAFVCSERAERALSRYGRLTASGEGDASYPPILPVRVNCTDTVGDAHVLHALAAGADGVAILGCGGSCLHSGPDPKARLAGRLNRATTDLGLGERVTFLAPDPDEPGAFLEELEAFADGLEPTPLSRGDHESAGHVAGAEESLPAYGNRVWALESVRAILAAVEPEREVIRGLEGFARMSVSDACAMTPTCEELCPVGAIRRQDGDLQFNHARCVDCGLCETGCPEGAIAMEPGLEPGLLPERAGDAWTTVKEGGRFACLGCGEPFASRATVETMKERLPQGELAGVEGHMAEYCNDCKAELSFGP